MRSLAEMFIVLQDNDTRGIYFFDEENVYNRITYKNLYKRCLNKLFLLQKKGLNKGHFLILLPERNQDMIEMFWAGILGGIIPIPMTQYANIEQMKKVVHVFELLGECNIYTSEGYSKVFADELSKNKLSDRLEKIKEKIITKEFLEINTENEGTINPGSGDETAFIQFSSGSTGVAKGVVVSHKNIISNVEDILIRSQIRDDDFSLSWLPLSHNLGMIGFHLTPLCKGLDFVLMDTMLFLRQPELWMDACTKFRITETSSPNFGYAHFMSKVSKDKEYKWDLSNLRIIYNGAEPINIDSIENFYNIMEQYNLNRTSMYLVYGMAEATLGITFPQPLTGTKYLSVDRNQLSPGECVKLIDENEPEAIKLGSCGTPLDKVQLKIINEKNEQVSQGVVGDIIIRGDNITCGYYKNKEKTEELFNSEGWLITGDMGFLYEGNVYVVGRKKDIIIINGVNYYSFDIERICEEIEFPFQTKFIAAAVRDPDSNDEKLAVFVLYKGDIKSFMKIEAVIRNEILTKLGIQVSYVIPTEEVYKTTSGKIQRFMYVKEFDSGKYNDVLKQLAKYSDIQTSEGKKTENNKFIVDKIIKIIKDETKIEEIDVDKNLSEYGINSISLMNIYSEINNLLPDKINISDLYTYSTINKLLEHICDDSDERQIISFDQERLENFMDKAPELNVSTDSVLFSALIYVYMYTIKKKKMDVNVCYRNGLYDKVEIDTVNISNPEELYIMFSDKLTSGKRIESIEMDGFNMKISQDYKMMEVKIKNLSTVEKNSLITNIKKLF